jgi:hypothetical protein
MASAWAPVVTLWLGRCCLGQDLKLPQMAISRAGSPSLCSATGSTLALTAPHCPVLTLLALVDISLGCDLCKEVLRLCFRGLPCLCTSGVSSSRESEIKGGLLTYP